MKEQKPYAYKPRYSIPRRFWQKVDKRGEDECWPWKASLGWGGYGKFRINNTYKAAHRTAYELHFGEDPKESLVCPTCDNRKCCNPKHLFLGTVYDNNRDKMLKGRSVGSGQGNSGYQLPKETVQKIRDLSKIGHSQRTIAKMFNVSKFLIFQVVNEKGIYNEQMDT